MATFTLILTPDQPCNWSSIKERLEQWHPAIQMEAEPTEEEARFSIELPPNEQEHLSAILELQQLLEPYGLSFSLEIRP